MGHGGEANDLALERFRQYLLVLAQLRLGRQFQGKLDASDVVQQTLLEAHRQRGQFQGHTDGQLAAWLRQLLAGTLADACRALGRAKRDAARERSLEAALDESSARLEAWLAADQSSPSQQADRNEQLVRLAEALARLPDDQRTAVQLKHLHGHAVAEIAEIMGRSPTAVGGLLRRGMTRLRELMGEPGETP
jgi:RNA polymerase sigma-70 factor (ECF subfamily)